MFYDHNIMLINNLASSLLLSKRLKIEILSIQFKLYSNRNFLQATIVYPRIRAIHLQTIRIVLFWLIPGLEGSRENNVLVYACTEGLMGYQFICKDAFI
jgi:hypothetical protein